MKTLTQAAVQQAAEFLIEKYGSTTTLDVKNRLRTAGYQAFQAEVSHLMDALAQQEQWEYQQNNRYRIYRFGPDTDEELHTYLERGNEFWEISSKNQEITINQGTVGSHGHLHTQTFPSNRKAIQRTQLLIKDQKQQGFQAAQDERLPLTLRQKFGSKLDQKPVACQLGYYDLILVEAQPANFYTDEQWQKGWWKCTKKAGGNLHWQLPQEQTQALSLIDQEEWPPTPLKASKLSLLGEKKQKEEAFLEDHQPLASFQEMQIEMPVDTLQVQAKRENLYQITFTLENGEKLRLSKFDLELETKLLPLARKILQNA